jgi:uncharacterized protein YqhQ
MSGMAQGKHKEVFAKNKQAIPEHDRESLILDMIGGQAVTEGVLMRDKTRYVIVVRGKNGIKMKKEKIRSIFGESKILKFPVIRGFFAFIDMMILGVNALGWSANQVAGDDEQLSKKEITIALLTALAFSLFLFVALPFFLTKLISKDTGIVFNLIDGVIRVAILIIYISLISLFPDIRRVFQYHGAEHKAVNCYEAGEKLTLKNVKKYPTQHPRCGTSFLIIVLFVSILTFSVITDNRWYIKLLSRIILIPLVMGFSYEILKLSSKLKNNPFIKILIFPGLMVQKLTTKEPDDKQLEIGIKALKELL